MIRKTNIVIQKKDVKKFITVIVYRILLMMITRNGDVQDIFVIIVGQVI